MDRMAPARRSAIPDQLERQFDSDHLCAQGPAVRDRRLWLGRNPYEIDHLMQFGRASMIPLGFRVLVFARA